MKLFKGCAEGVHKFEPRYDETGPEWLLEAIKMNSITDVQGFRRDKRYVCDVCVRCGKVVDARQIQRPAQVGLQAIPGNASGAGRGF